MAQDLRFSLKTPFPNRHVVHHLGAKPGIAADPRTKDALRRPVSVSRGVGGILTYWRPKLPDIYNKPSADCRWPVDCNSKREPERAYCEYHSRLAYQGGFSSKAKGAATAVSFVTRSMAPWLK